MGVSTEDVLHVAGLARLGVSADRVPQLATELNSILAHMEALQRLDVSRVQAATGVGGGERGMPLRDDAGPSVLLEQPLESLAPEMRDGLLLVPRLATHGDADDADMAEGA